MIEHLLGHSRRSCEYTARAPRIIEILRAHFLVTLSLLIAARPVSADSSAGGFLIGVDGSTTFDVDKGAQRPDIADLTMLRAHALLASGSDRVRYAYGADVGVGMTFGGAGLAYEATVFPIGIGLELGTHDHPALLTFRAGVSGSGAAGSLPAAAGLPFQLDASIHLGTDNVIVKVRTTTLAGDTARASGSPTLRGTSFDELEAMLAIQAATNIDANGLLFPLEGWYYGAAYRELENAHFVGLVIGWQGGEELW